MTIEIKVGPPVITISQGRTFMVTDRHGYINTDSDEGIYAIDRLESYRPPEVFAGVKRQGEVDFPVLYPGGANIPQAWATGSIFHMVRTLLGLRADAPHKRLYVNPTLPAWIPDMEVQRLRVGPCSITLRFWREGSASRREVREITTDQGVAQEDQIQVTEDLA